MEASDEASLLELSSFMADAWVDGPVEWDRDARVGTIPFLQEDDEAEFVVVDRVDHDPGPSRSRCWR